MRDPGFSFSRRRVLIGSAALAGATMLSGCDDLGKLPWVRRVLDKDEDANLFVQRLLLSNQRLAPEFAETDLSPSFKANGTDDPKDRDYKALVKDGFASYQLEIGGLVERPERFSLAALRAFPSRTQITRHDCVEGWSCIGKWTGVPLGDLLHRVGLKPQARFVVFYCADSMDDGGSGLSEDTSDDEPDQKAGANEAGKTSADAAKADDQDDDNDASQATPQAADGKKAGDSKKAASTTLPTASGGDAGNRYYESIDLEDAFHPQTILAYAMNGKPLPVPHGAPLRLRVERQLGYKMAKYIMRIAVTDRLEGIGQGGGGYWEDQGYEWYAGI